MVIKGGIPWNKGKHHSLETKRKIGLASKRRICSVETRIKLSKAKCGENHPFYNKHHSEETKRNISKKLKGRKLSLERRRNMSYAKTLINISKRSKSNHIYKDHQRKIECAINISSGMTEGFEILKIINGHEAKYNPDIMNAIIRAPNGVVENQNLLHEDWKRIEVMKNG